MPKRVLGKTGKSLLLYKLQNSRDSGGVADSTQGSSMQWFLCNCVQEKTYMAFHFLHMWFLSGLILYVISFGKNNICNNE